MSLSSSSPLKVASFWVTLSATNPYYVAKADLAGGTVISVKSFKNNGGAAATVSVGVLNPNRSVVSGVPSYSINNDALGTSERIVEFSSSAGFLSLNSPYAPVHVLVEAFNFITEPDLNVTRYVNAQSITINAPHTAVLLGGGGGGGLAAAGGSSTGGAGSGYLATGTINAGTYSLVLGAGAAGGANGTRGGTSTFSNLTALGGFSANLYGSGAGGSGGGGLNSGLGGVNGNSGTVNGGAGSGVAGIFFLTPTAAAPYTGGGTYGGGGGAGGGVSVNGGGAYGYGGGGGGCTTISANTNRSGGSGAAGALYLKKI